jgi:hypothetical protein
MIFNILSFLKKLSKNSEKIRGVIDKMRVISYMGYGNALRIMLTTLVSYPFVIARLPDFFVGRIYGKQIKSLNPLDVKDSLNITLASTIELTIMCGQLLLGSAAAILITAATPLLLPVTVLVAPLTNYIAKSSMGRKKYKALMNKFYGYTERISSSVAILSLFIITYYQQCVTE